MAYILYKADMQLKERRRVNGNQIEILLLARTANSSIIQKGYGLLKWTLYTPSNYFCIQFEKKANAILIDATS